MHLWCGAGQKSGAASGKVGVQTTKDREGHILKGRGAAGAARGEKAGLRGEKQHPPVGLLAGRGPGRQVIKAESATGRRGLADLKLQGGPWGLEELAEGAVSPGPGMKLGRWGLASSQP